MAESRSSSPASELLGRSMRDLGEKLGGFALASHSQIVWGIVERLNVAEAENERLREALRALKTDADTRIAHGQATTFTLDVANISRNALKSRGGGNG
jgi:hypothetical protein